MRRLWLALALVGVASGCGLSEDKFRDEYVGAYCPMLEECAGDTDSFVLFDDEGQCRLFMTAIMAAAATQEGCEYDKSAARDCIDELESATCKDLNASGGGASCQKVYGAACTLGDTDDG